MKTIRTFLSENFQFLVVKFSIYLNRRVFVMRKKIALLGSTFFPFSDDPFSEGARCAGKQTGSLKSCPPHVLKWRKLHQIYGFSVHLSTVDSRHLEV